MATPQKKENSYIAAHLRLAPLVGYDRPSLVNDDSFLHVIEGGVHGNSIVVGKLRLLIVT